MNQMSNEELAFLTYLLRRFLVDPRLNYGEKMRVRSIEDLASAVAAIPPAEPRCAA